MQMNQKELTKSFLLVSIWEKPFGRHGLYKHISALSGLDPHPPHPHSAEPRHILYRPTTN